MKNNIIHIGIFCLILLGMTACDDSFLDEKVLDRYAPESLNDRLGFEASAIGLHRHFISMYTNDQDQTIQAMWHVGTDILWAPSGRSNGDSRSYFSYSQMNSLDPAARKIWSSLYVLINNANLLIDAAENNNPTGMTAAEISAFNAEARFFRAYAYNMLVTLYGDVPLLTAPLTAPKTDFVRTPANEVNAVIEQDLLFATEFLPNAGSARNESRINKMIAHQLLAEVYLRLDKPAEAEVQASTIINNGRYSLVRQRYGVRSSLPGDHFSDMFIKGNQRRSQGNTEAIWVLEMENPADVSGGGFGAPQQRRIWVGGYYDVPGMEPADSLGGRGIARVRLNNWVLYGLYDDQDVRNSQFNIKRKLYFNNQGSAYDNIRGQEVPYGQNRDITLANGNVIRIFQADTIWRMAPYSMKWGEFDVRDVFGYAMWKDFMVMRLGETYLLRAEARMKTGDLAGAAADINVLRERANAPLVTSSQITLDFILDERARELLAEENRRMTLVRTGTLVERARRLTGTTPLANGEIETTDGLQDFHMKLPIPQSEIDLNKDAVLRQNDGY
ncbi:RagB/SusD family nutrient uptake outer membrane protein [Belliella sp. DSM 111904]|uniref:RagB/SusD family nutrient uptake outer membrane protein n=1 Tax=Belliella filtrata TaxID=2923435 RepID=A0ABS9V284_9BACT|nr:RagB/SusD family nutrient uptake outer membrane protein [Belliella filtrata]MCH7410523.1 RagB/SusD family nutrient uptake outer membrane protein [Belliella filtrata]